MFGQSLLSAFGIACTTDTDQLFVSNQSITSAVTYELNGNANSIGGSFNGTEGSSLSYTTGKFGQAASFDATSNSYINWGTGNTAGINNNNITFSFWIKPHSTPNGSGTDFQRALITTQNTYYMYIAQSDTNKIKFSNDQQVSGDPVNGYVTESNSSVSLNVWTHVALSMSSTDGTKIYINGVLDKTQSNRKNNASSISGESFIGGYRSNSGSSPYEYFYDGEIDQIRTFNSVLPQAAITALYNETTTTATSASIDYLAANPNSIAYYKMSNATDQINNYNFTAYNVNFNVEGKFGFAGEFNGSTSSYMTRSNSFLPTGNASRSFSFWTKLNTHHNDAYFMSYGNGATGQFFSPRVTPTSQGGYISFMGFGADLNSNVVMTTGEWMHLCYTYDGTTLKIYKNAIEIASGNLTLNTSQTRPFIMGARDFNASITKPIDGLIDQVRIYDSAISAANVTTLYKEIECSPAAINALDQFNTVTYDGTGGSQSTNSLSNQVGTLGFAPGMTWIKSRSNATWHEVHDVVRGNLPRIFPNDSYQELTSANGFASLNSNGFSLDATGSGGDVNTSGRTYVAWNWKAALANLSTSFNGSSSKIEVTNSGNVFEAVGGFSASVWINRNTTANQTILNKEGGVSGSYGWSLRYTSGLGYSYDLYDTSNNQVTVSTGANSTTGTWEHIVISFNNSDNKLRIYYNGGTPVVSSALSSAASSNTENFFIGARTNGGIVANGNLAQTRIYSAAITDAQVSDLYTEPAASNNTLNYPAGAGCIAAYPLQTDAVDLSGNYSGTSSNVTFGKPGYLTSNNDGSITSIVSANVAAGFSIVSFTCPSSNQNFSIGHGLGVKPGMVIMKKRNAVGVWLTWHKDLSVESYYLQLNSALGESGITQDDRIWGQQSFTSTTISSSTGYSYDVNDTVVAYCFAEIPGYSKIGSYIGNGTSQSLYTGFAVKFVLIKSITSSQNWMIYDSTRGGNKYLIADSAGAEGTSGSNLVTFNSNGFSVSNSNSENQSGQTFIFLAIA